VNGDRIWFGHSASPAVSSLSLPGGDLPLHWDVPAVPFGLAVGGDGRLWMALPDADCCAALTPGTGEMEIHHLPAGSRPMSLVWCGDRLYVACARTSQLVVFD
jgi:streptogramin lyase